MLALGWGRVLAVLAERSGVQELATDIGPALCYPLLTGPVAVGDRVLLNTLADERSLGTGGQHLVAQVAGRERGPGAGGGRHVKLRYTPWQLPFCAAEEAGPLPSDLGGMPVVAGSLHSQLGPVAVGFKQVAPVSRLAYVMTDGGALPVWVSRLVAQLRSAGFVDTVVTAGNAFGGEREAIGVPSALLVARSEGCDAAVVCMGPGVLGTATAWGHTALEQAWAVETAAASTLRMKEEAAAASILRPEEAVGAADILHLGAAGASPTSDDLLMPLSRRATRSRNSGRPMPASRAHTPS